MYGEPTTLISGQEGLFVKAETKNKSSIRDLYCDVPGKGTSHLGKLFKAWEVGGGCSA